MKKPLFCCLLEDPCIVAENPHHNILGPRVKSSDRHTKFQRCLVYSDVEQIKIRPGLSPWTEHIMGYSA